MKKKYFCIFVLLCLCGLYSSAQDTIKYKEFGFLIYKEYFYYNFIPVKEMDINDPFESFKNSNFNVGFQFNELPVGFNFNVETVFKRVLHDSTLASFWYETRVIPIALTYCIKFLSTQKEFQKIYKETEILEINNRRRKIKYEIDFRKIIDIRKAEPLIFNISSR